MPELDVLPEYKLKKLKSSKKFVDWCGYFFDNSNTQTYGNKTQSAIKAYKLDPDTQYSVAASMGYQNFKKLQLWASEVGCPFVEEMGFGLKQLMELGIEKVKKGSYKDWESFMLLLGYFRGNSKADSPIQLNQTNINIAEDIRRIEKERGLVGTTLL